jgi:hypothetical protein
VWTEKGADWILRYVLRERRKVCAYTLSYRLVDVDPAWQPHITISYQGTPIQGFYYHSIEFKNEGNRSVERLPFVITVTAGSLIAWPVQFPQGCLQGLSSPAPNQLAGHIDFINPKEEVRIAFWAFNDTAGALSIAARAPDVEFKTAPRQSATDIGYKIGVVIHQIIFWIGVLIVLAGIAYGA